MIKASLLPALALALLASCASQQEQSRVIKTDVPVRPAGQEDMVAFAAEPIDTVRVGIVGLGMRGSGAVDRMSHIPTAKVVALCDIDSARVAKSQAILANNGAAPAKEFWGSDTAYLAMVQDPDIDLIYVCTDWQHHVPISLAAMENGKHVACEVPAAHSLEDIWNLINTSERTRKHMMMLENCCYDDFELTALNMAQQGLFGEVLHAEGSYIHNLSDFWNAYWNNWRMEFNETHAGDIYATHGVGPAAQLLDLHRGDMLTTLVAMDTKSVSGPDFVEKTTGTRPEPWKNGDHTMTMLKTANGKTLQIQHDVVTPRPYSRMYQVTGTKGFANKYQRNGIVLDKEIIADEMPDHENLSSHDWLPKEQYDSLMEKYKHPILVEIGEKAKQVGGHGGMDFVMDYRLIYCLNNGLPLDIDVYDMAEWCSLAPLGAISIENGSAPVEVPDFTRGGGNKVKGFRHAYADKAE